MSSATSTERRPARDSGFQTWHFYILLSMVAATVAVMLSAYTHPAALLLLSAAVISAGLVGVAMHTALAGFIGQRRVAPAPRSDRERDVLEREKALALRSIKELEFDRAMGKVSDADFAEIGGRLRARALALMDELDRRPEPAVAVEVDERGTASPPGAAGASPIAAGPETTAACSTCDTVNDADARFCKQCGARLGGDA